MYFKTIAALLDGVHTDFIVSTFKDTIFIVITQNNKLGTLYLFKPECLSSDDQGYDIQALFGRDDDNLNTSVVNLMRALNVDRRTIISLMLDNTSFRTIRAIQEVLSSLI